MPVIRPITHASPASRPPAHMSRPAAPTTSIRHQQSMAPQQQRQPQQQQQRQQPEQPQGSRAKGLKEAQQVIRPMQQPVQQPAQRPLQIPVMQQPPRPKSSPQVAATTPSATNAYLMDQMVLLGMMPVPGASFSAQLQLPLDLGDDDFAIDLSDGEELDGEHDSGASDDNANDG